MISPAAAIFSLPPVYSGHSIVLTMYRRGFFEIDRIAASTLSAIAAVPVSTTSTPASPACTVMFAPALGGDRRRPQHAEAQHAHDQRRYHTGRPDRALCSHLNVSVDPLGASAGG